MILQHENGVVKCF